MGDGVKLALGIFVLFVLWMFFILGVKDCDVSKQHESKIISVDTSATKHESTVLQNKVDSSDNTPEIKIIVTPGFNTGLRYDVWSGKIKYLPDFDGWD